MMLLFCRLKAKGERAANTVHKSKPNRSSNSWGHCSLGGHRSPWSSETTDPLCAAYFRELVAAITVETQMSR